MHAEETALLLIIIRTPLLSDPGGAHQGHDVTPPSAAADIAGRLRHERDGRFAWLKQHALRTRSRTAWSQATRDASVEADPGPRLASAASVELKQPTFMSATPAN